MMIFFFSVVIRVGMDDKFKGKRRNKRILLLLFDKGRLECVTVHVRALLIAFVDW